MDIYTLRTGLCKLLGSGRSWKMPKRSFVSTLPPRSPFFMSSYLHYTSLPSRFWCIFFKSHISNTELLRYITNEETTKMELAHLQGIRTKVCNSQMFILQHSHLKVQFFLCRHVTFFLACCWDNNIRATRTGLHPNLTISGNSAKPQPVLFK